MILLNSITSYTSVGSRIKTGKRNVYNVRIKELDRLIPVCKAKGKYFIKSTKLVNIYGKNSIVDYDKEVSIKSI